MVINDLNFGFLLNYQLAINCMIEIVNYNSSRFSNNLKVMFSPQRIVIDHFCLIALVLRN